MTLANVIPICCRSELQPKVGLGDQTRRWQGGALAGLHEKISTREASRRAADTPLPGDGMDGINLDGPVDSAPVSDKEQEAIPYLKLLQASQPVCRGQKICWSRGLIGGMKCISLATFPTVISISCKRKPTIFTPARCFLIKICGTEQESIYPG